MTADGTLSTELNSSEGYYAEISSLIMASTLATLQEYPDKLVNDGVIDYDEVANRLAKAAEKNRDTMLFFKQKAIASNDPVFKEFCDQAVARYEERLVFYRSEQVSAHQKIQSFIDDINSGVSRDLTNAFGRGATIGRMLPALDKGLTVLDLTTALVNQDWGKVAGIAFGYLATELIAVVLTGVAVTVFGTAAAATAVVAIPIALVAAVAGWFIGEELETEVFDGAFGTGEDETIRERLEHISRMLADTGQAYVPEFTSTFVYGDMVDDVISTTADHNNAVFALSGNDIVYGNLNDDFISGGEGNDSIEGQGGHDRLLGGAGDDTLDGGRGNDYLEGEFGFDVYRFNSSDFINGSSKDTIIDSDGLGEILFNGVNIAGTGIGLDHISRDGFSWATADETFRFLVIGDGAERTLVIVHRETASRILVEGWQNGELGITLPTYNQPGTPENPYLLTSGDDIVGSDGDKNPETPHSGNDIIVAQGGNDGIDGGYGDDHLDGGSGNDLLLGGPGSNRVVGGEGNDIILNYSMVWDVKPWPEDDTIMGRAQTVARLLASPATISFGNGWNAFSGTSAGWQNNIPYDPENAYQRLNTLQIQAWGPVDQNAATQDVWIYLDPNQYRNGDDDIDAGGGDDVVLGGEGNDFILAGTGADLALGGYDDDFIDGEDGDDIILGDNITGGGGGLAFISTIHSTAANAGGDDILVGGAGNDRIYGQGGSDTIDGGEGDDILSGDRLDYGLEFAIEQSVASGDDVISGGAGNDQIYGDAGNDTISGGTGADLIVGDSLMIEPSLHGADVIEAGEGNDTVYGLGGNDVIHGDAGDDLLIGDADESQLGLQYHGSDRIYGGAGADQLQGGGGDDYLDGGSEDDKLFGESGNDHLMGGQGADELVGGSGDDSLNGGEGNDKLWGEAGNDTLNGGTGDDQLQGGDGVDSLSGGNGADQLWGDAGNDTLLGGSDADQLAGGAGSDYLDGGADNDILNGNAGADILLGGDGSDNISGNEDDDTISGGAGNDALFGDEGNDILRGEAGNDTLVGGDGDDVIDGGTGNDNLSGGLGNDTYQFNAGFGQDWVTGLGDENSGSCTIVLGEGITASDTYWVYNGDDLIIYAGREMHGTWTTWRDSVVLQGFALSNGRHNIVYADGSVRAYGTSGDDILAGGAGSDDLEGYAGNDVIHAGDGDDRISGGDGFDEAHGGLGNDVYYGIEDIRELEDGGTDTAYIGDLYQPMTYTLSANVENLIYTTYSTSSYPYTINGNDGDNTIEIVNSSGWALHSAIVNGGAGADKYVFGSLSGMDRYITIYLDNIGDTWEGYDSQYMGGERSPGTDRFRIYSTLNVDFQFDQSVREFRSLGTEAITVTGDGRANILDGSANSAANVLAGAGANDTYYADAGDVIIETVDGGIDTVTLGGSSSSITGSYILADNVERLVSNLSGVLYGNDLDNTISFGYGGGTLYGGGGDDSLVGGSQAATLYGGTGNDTLWGGSGSTTDVLDGGAGNDAMQGRNGSDIYYVDSVGDVVTEYVDNGNDKVFSSIDFVLPDNVEQLELLAAATSATGNASYNTLVGNDADNTLAGGLNSDQLYGGFGADTYLYSLGDGWDTIHESENELNKVDVLRLAAGITTADVQVRRTVSEGTHIIIGGERIRISDGIEYAHQHDLNEISRLEQIHFSDGTIWNVEDVVQINAAPVLGAVIQQQEVLRGQPYIFVLPTDTFLNEADESLTLQIDYLPEWLTFDPQTQTFSGTPPVDAYAYENMQITAIDTWGQSVTTYISLVVLNEVIGTESADTLIGTDDPDRILGLAGNDIINGGWGSDIMLGGAGDDTYTVEDEYDQVVESVGEGNDLVSASVSYMLGDHVEMLTLTGSSTIDGTGNALNNVLTGNSRPNTLQGLDGDDTLDGKSGADTLVGGMGNDAYVVDNANDVVVELAGEGLDTVRSSVTHVLSQNVEGLVLSGSSGISGSGNALDNTLTGNGGANTLRGYEGNDVLDGGNGSDTMIGGIGDDIYVVGATGDVVTELASEGEDTIRSSITYTLGANVEQLTLTGTSAINGTGNGSANVLSGNSGSNALSGLAGNDMLEGKAGTDTLTGGTGNDTYLMARTYGADTVVENDTTAGNADVARILSGVAYDQLWFKRPASSNNLEISIIGTTDKLLIKDWYLGSQYRVEEIRTDDGNRVLLAADVQALVTAMAGMTMPAQGQTTLTTGQHTTLDPIFNSTWQSAPQGMLRVSSSLPATFIVEPSAEESSTHIASVLYGQTKPHQPISDEPEVAVQSTDFSTFWQDLERHDPPNTGWNTLMDAFQFEREGHEEHKPGFSILTKPLLISDEGSQSGQGRSRSDCHNLIAMMSIADRFDPEAFHHHASERLYQLIP